MNKLKDWFPVEQNVNATEKKVIRAFEKWYRQNLTIIKGRDKTVELTFGFPYTSSSDYAGVWNCQAEARLKSDLQWCFRALAISEDRDVIAVFDREDTGKFDNKEIVIGRI